MATEERILGCPLRNLACSSTHCVACGEVASDRACSRRMAWLGLGLGSGLGLGLGLGLALLPRFLLGLMLGLMVGLMVGLLLGLGLR